MGNSLVNRAIGMRPNYAHVSASAWLVLIRMSATALDREQAATDDRVSTPARCYFAGWRPLALMLGRKVDSDEPLDAAAHKAVMRAVRELTDCGVIGRAPPEFQEGFRHRVYLIRLE